MLFSRLHFRQSREFRALGDVEGKSEVENGRRAELLGLVDRNQFGKEEAKVGSYDDGYTGSR